MVMAVPISESSASIWKRRLCQQSPQKGLFIPIESCPTSTKSALETPIRIIATRNALFMFYPFSPGGSQRAVPAMRLLDGSNDLITGRFLSF